MEAKVKDKRKVTFKRYEQAQKINIPVDVSDMIPAGHLCRIIDRVVNQIALEKLETYYSGGGSSSYHPKMMIKVLVYGYCERVYTSRRLAKALREQIPFIWLSGCATPCFKTLSEFRGERMQDMIDIVFKQVLLILVEEGYIDMEDLYVDGSKWEANANRHKVVWKKNTERYKASVLDRIESLLKEVKSLQAAEDEEHGKGDLPEVGEGKDVTVVLNSASASKYLVNLNQLIEKKAEEKAEEKAQQKAQQKALKKIGKSLLEEQEKLEKYEQQEKLLDGRNSYSKTDTDATVLHMKDGQSLPAYNVQHMTGNQYIVNWTIEQCASDSPTLPAQLDKLEERLEGLPVPMAAEEGEEGAGDKLGQGQQGLPVPMAAEEGEEGAGDKLGQGQQGLPVPMAAEEGEEGAGDKLEQGLQGLPDPMAAEEGEEGAGDKLEEGQQGLPVPIVRGLNLGGDAGYGSEENYAELEKRGINAFVKYPMFDQEQSGELLKHKFRRENFPYDEQGDSFTCPQDRKLNFIEERDIVSANGYEKTIRLYQCENCDNCPFAADCKKSEAKARTVSFSPAGEAYKQQARTLLKSEKGLEMRSERGIEVESAFGDIKYNMKHERFILRERKKVYVEYGLLAIGHNLRKVYCAESGIWAAYYAQRAEKRAQKRA